MNFQNSNLSSNTSEKNKATEFLHKTISVKNQHIEELIQELKKTQDLHQSLKKKYQ